MRAIGRRRVSEQSSAPAAPAWLRGLTVLCGAAAAAQGLGRMGALAQPVGAPTARGLAAPDAVAGARAPWYQRAETAPPPRPREDFGGDSITFAATLEQGARLAAGVDPREFADADADPAEGACRVDVEDLQAATPHGVSRDNVRHLLVKASAQPFARIDGSPVEWVPVPAGTRLYSERYGNAPHVLDIRQSTQLGDCQLLAEMASLAARFPSFIKGMISVVPDATMPAGVTHYQVRVFVRDAETRTNLPVWVDVDDLMPVDALGRIGAFTYDFLNRTDTFKWVAVVEKAVAKLQQSYQVDWQNGLTGYAALNQGGLHQYRTVLTGQPAMYQGLGVTDLVIGAGQSQRMIADRFDALWSFLQDPRMQVSLTIAAFDDMKHVKDHRGASLLHPGYCRLNDTIRWRDGMVLQRVGPYGMRLSSADRNRVLPLFSRHAYAVVGANDAVALLYNPWGFNGAAVAQELSASAADAAAAFSPPAAAPGLAPAPAPAAAGAALAQAATFGPPASLAAASRTWDDPVLRMTRDELHRLLQDFEVGYGPQAPDDVAPLAASLGTAWGQSRTESDRRAAAGLAAPVPG